MQLLIRQLTRSDPESHPIVRTVMHQEVLVGRSSTVDVMLDDLAISLVHLRVLRRGESILIEDLQSANGTFLNGHRIAPKTVLSISPNDCIDLGRFRLQIALSFDMIPMEKSHTASYARDVAKSLLGMAATHKQPYLEVQRGIDQGKTLHVSSMKSYRVGRTESCDLILQDADVSRHHVEVRWDAGRFSIVDADSKNGVSVNGSLVNKTQSLRHGDLIQLGQTVLRFVDSRENLFASEPQPQDLSNLSSEQHTVEDLHPPATLNTPRSRAHRRDLFVPSILIGLVCAAIALFIWLTL